MTNTLIETGARHMQQCRTNYDVLLALAGGNEQDLRESDKWSLAKDELAVCCNKQIFADAPKVGTKYAYPSVISCIGAFQGVGYRPSAPSIFLACYYHFVGQYKPSVISAFVHEGEPKCTLDDIDALAEEDHATPPPIIHQLRTFNPLGYSVGKAFSHGGVGDTMASVQIGGLRTVINGGFDVQTGDLIQMYIPDVEHNLFNAVGGRVFLPADMTVLQAHNFIGTKSKDASLSEKQRREFYNRGNGIAPGPDRTGRIKTGVFSIKPYLETANEYGHQYYGDKMRVFARALSSARPWEPVDIMIARQSL